MKDIKKITKSTGTYFLGSVLSKVIVFFMLPLYTAYIPAANMGYYDSSVAIITFFISVLFLDIGIGIMRFMLEKKQEGQDQKYALYSGIIIFLASSGLYALLAVICAIVFDFQYFLWIAIYGFLVSLNQVYGFITRAYGANVLYAVSGIVTTLINVGCNLVFILVLKWDYKSLYISFIISRIIHIIILEFKCKLIVNFSLRFFDKELFRKMLFFSMPLCLNSIAFWFLNSANKVIVTAVMGTEYNGYLAVADKFTQILYLVSSCFQLAWQELTFSKENKLNQSTGVYYSKAFDLYLRILMGGLLLAIPAIKIGLAIFPDFIDSQYYDSIILIPLALTGTIFSVANLFLGSIFGGLKKNNVIFISTLVGAIVNVVVIFALINYLGVMAANIAFISGFAVALFVRTFVLKKQINMKVKYWYFAILIPLLAIVIFIYNNLGWIYNLIAFFALVCICIIVFKEEIMKILNKFKKRRA